MSEASRKVWQHNSYFGWAKLIEAHAHTLTRAETTSDTTRLLASEIEKLAGKLRLSLKERRS